MGLRSFLTNIKAASSAAYLAASGRLLEGIGAGPKPRPFNADAALKQFRHWAYAAAMMNANAVANVPMRLYVRSRPGAKRLYETHPVDRRTKRMLRGQGDFLPSKAVLQKVATFAGDLEEVVEPHPALTVLQKVNPFENGYSLAVLQMIDLQVTGNSYAHIVDGPAGVPSELWRMPPNLVEIIGSKTQFIDGYIYGRKPEARTFGVGEVIQFKMPNPSDLLYGMGWYEAAWSAIGLHDSKRRMDLAKFDNYMRPDYLLSVKSATLGTKKETIDKFAEDVERRLKGPSNAGKFLAIAGDVTATALNQSMEEVGTATRVIEEISAVSGVPVAMLLSNDPSKAGAGAARAGWYRNTVRPYCRLHEEKLNEQWLPRFEGSEDYVLSYDLASFEDEEMQSKRLIGLVSGGIIKPNEARAELSYDRLDDEAAEMLYPPSGLTSGAAAVGGNISPQQNDDRHNEDLN